MRILVPYFGQTERFFPILQSWWWHYRWAIRPTKDVQVALLTDLPSWGHVQEVATYLCEPSKGDSQLAVDVCDPTPFAELIRPGQPFDVKGALVCAWLLSHKEDVLVLDADAVLRADPRPLLEPFARHPIAMPTDDGALTHGREAHLIGEFAGTAKRCAGVIWFPAHAGRGRLVAAYRKAWGELRTCEHWTPHLPHLLEQHAWSLACRRRGGGVLPRALNWSPDHLGENAEAVVYHRYGLAKWQG